MISIIPMVWLWVCLCRGSVGLGKKNRANVMVRLWLAHGIVASLDLVLTSCDRKMRLSIQTSHTFALNSGLKYTVGYRTTGYTGLEFCEKSSANETRRRGKYVLQFSVPWISTQQRDYRATALSCHVALGCLQKEVTGMARAHLPYPCSGKYYYDKCKIRDGRNSTFESVSNFSRTCDKTNCQVESGPDFLSRPVVRQTPTN